MSDQGFREIQLSGKQLVFLFMASVVVAVGVFLLGVSVGRGVRRTAGPAGTQIAEASTVAPVPAEMPPPTTMTPEDTQYSDLDKAGDASGASGATSRAAAQLEAEPAAVSEPVAPVTVPEKPTAPPPAPAVAAPPPTPASKAVQPPATATAKPREPAAARGASGQWWLQVNAFKTRAAADRQVATLKAKGHTGTVVAGDGLFRVRVGPFRDSADAQRTAARLKRDGVETFAQKDSSR